MVPWVFSWRIKYCTKIPTCFTILLWHFLKIVFGHFGYHIRRVSVWKSNSKKFQKIKEARGEILFDLSFLHNFNVQFYRVPDWKQRKYSTSKGKKAFHLSGSTVEVSSTKENGHFLWDADRRSNRGIISHIGLKNMNLLKSWHEIFINL